MSFPLWIRPLPTFPACCLIIITVTASLTKTEFPSGTLKEPVCLLHIIAEVFPLTCSSVSHWCIKMRKGSFICWAHLNRSLLVSLHHHTLQVPLFTALSLSHSLHLWKHINHSSLPHVFTSTSSPPFFSYSSGSLPLVLEASGSLATGGLFSLW